MPATIVALACTHLAQCLPQPRFLYDKVLDAVGCRPPFRNHSPGISGVQLLIGSGALGLASSYTNHRL